VLESRHLLQTPSSVASVSTDRIVADLAVSDSAHVGTGKRRVRNAFRPFCGTLPVDYLICASTNWMPQQPHDVPLRQQQALAKHWPTSKLLSGALPIASNHKQQFIDTSLAIDRYHFPQRQTLRLRAKEDSRMRSRLVSTQLPPTLLTLLAAGPDLNSTGSQWHGTRMIAFVGDI
jgi:hypothetical protein